MSPTRDLRASMKVSFQEGLTALDSAMMVLRIAQDVDDVYVRGGMRLMMVGSGYGWSLGIGEDRKRSGWGFGWGVGG
ncbi:hypothetical protein ACFX2C_040557 [Malus domestica]